MTDLLSQAPRRSSRFFVHVIAWLVGAFMGASCYADTPLAPTEVGPPPLVPVAQLCMHVAPSSTELPQWDIFLELDDWRSLLVDVYADVTVEASLCVDGERYPLRFELHGSSTRRERKKGFDLKLQDRSALETSPFFFDEATGQGLPRAILKAMYRDNTLVRESVAFDIWRALGHDAPRTDYVNLRINGSDQGLYVLVEPVDETYVAQQGLGDDSTLYKAVRKHGERADFHPNRDIYAAFENKTDELAELWPDLEDLITRLQRTPLNEAAFVRDIDPIFSIDDYLDRIAWVSFTQNGDAVAQNFFLSNRSGDVEHADWHLIPWDSNLCLGMIWNMHDAISEPSAQLMIDGDNYFSERLMRIPALRERYASRYANLLDDVWTEAYLADLLREHSQRVAHDLARDQMVWNRKVSPSDATEAVATFLQERPAHVDEALDVLVGPVTQPDAGVDSGAVDAGAVDASDMHDEER